ncbi:hypothetical protein JAAARDRAFT_37510 [Jaapia argillacea MUCL 33604]|uniref:Uncharacterized protein n=1 Tax=Jaapia argillacea MUCL 33604 TaxID=933084 RepID=A0A067PNV3_9AGAM|nr:hypothetical protein JAAARDRAFT_37510 [Jaapia argillacea MUCL 33604]
MSTQLEDLNPSPSHPVSNQSTPPTPYCQGLSELPSATSERALLALHAPTPPTPLSIHLSHGLAYTTGSALGSHPPSVEQCHVAFLVPNRVGLTAGARAWTKHFHRSQGPIAASPGDDDVTAKESEKKRKEKSEGWWGIAKGSVSSLNELAEKLFWRVMDGASWRNLHWLPHFVLVYEVRVPEGYGMRWSQDQSGGDGGVDGVRIEADGSSGDGGGGLPGLREDRPWVFRGFVEPMMEDGHEKGWRH